MAVKRSKAAVDVGSARTAVVGRVRPTMCGSTRAVKGPSSVALLDLQNVGRLSKRSFGTGANVPPSPVGCSSNATVLSYLTFSRNTLD
jgi:hypothetical protein